MTTETILGPSTVRGLPGEEKLNVGSNVRKDEPRGARYLAGSNDGKDARKLVRGKC